MVQMEEWELNEGENCTPMKRAMAVDSNEKVVKRALRIPHEITSLLHLLPSKTDFNELAIIIEKMVKQDIMNLQQVNRQLAEQIQKISEQILISKKTGEVDGKITPLLTKVSRVQLRPKDMKDRLRRNNMRVRGLPELDSLEHLETIVRESFKTLLEGDYRNSMEIDQTHRAQGLRQRGLNKSRDITCRIYLFKIKDEIMLRSWQKRPLHFRGAHILLLPDLSKNSLRRRRILKSLLEVIKKEGATYRWGYRLHLIVKKDEWRVTVNSMKDLTNLFGRLKIPELQIDDWMLDLSEDELIN